MRPRPVHAVLWALLCVCILRQLDERAARGGVGPVNPGVNGEHQTMANKREQAPGVVGTWTKATTAACADKYPATVTFSTGTYRGTRGPGQGMVWWDAGIYRLEDPEKLVVGTATDELVTYQIDVQADRFNVTDSEGCRVTYRRETRTP